jgi:predicted transcriptional regulator
MNLIARSATAIPHTRAQERTWKLSFEKRPPCPPAPPSAPLGLGGCRTLTEPTRIPTLAGMEVDFTPEQIAQLSQIASYCGKDVTELVKEAALRVAEEDRLFLEAVEQGIEEADRGELIDHAEVVARFERKYGA